MPLLVILAAWGKWIMLCMADENGSIVGSTIIGGFAVCAYMPFGYRRVIFGCVAGFNGQLKEINGFYLLGNGYRGFSPVFRRFISPDTLSPFDKGGVNCYGYCDGDPINREDSSGHFSLFGRKIFSSRISAVLAGGRAARFRPKTPRLLGYHGTQDGAKIARKGYFSAGEVYLTNSIESASKYAGPKGKVFGAYVDESQLSVMSARYAPKINMSSGVVEMPLNIHANKLVRAQAVASGPVVDLNGTFNSFGKTNAQYHAELLAKSKILRKAR